MIIVKNKRAATSLILRNISIRYFIMFIHSIIKSLVSTAPHMRLYDAVLWEYQYFEGNAGYTGYIRYNDLPAAVWAHYGHNLSGKHAVHGGNSHPDCF